MNKEELDKILDLQRDICNYDEILQDILMYLLWDGKQSNRIDRGNDTANWIISEIKKLKENQKDTEQ